MFDNDEISGSLFYLEIGDDDAEYFWLVEVISIDDGMSCFRISPYDLYDIVGNMGG